MPEIEPFASCDATRMRVVRRAPRRRSLANAVAGTERIFTLAERRSIFDTRNRYASGCTTRPAISHMTIVPAISAMLVT